MFELHKCGYVIGSISSNESRKSLFFPFFVPKVYRVCHMLTISCIQTNESVLFSSLLVPFNRKRVRGDAARPLRHPEACYAHLLLIWRNFSTFQVGSLDPSLRGLELLLRHLLASHFLFRVLRIAVLVVCVETYSAGDVGVVTSGSEHQCGKYMLYSRGRHL